MNAFINYKFCAKKLTMKMRMRMRMKMRMKANKKRFFDNL